MVRTQSPSTEDSSPDSLMSARLVLVDDDPELRELIERLLDEAGYTVALLSSGEQLEAELAERPADLLILDVMLPGRDGFDLCRELRQKGHDIPIIMLTAREEEIDRVLGLELGADDYVTKPFSGRELLARIKALLRRRREGTPYEKLRTYRFSGWTFRPDRMEIVSRDRLSVTLSATEAALLTTFVTHAGKTLNREDLFELTNGYTPGPFSRSLDTQVSRLRRKLSRDDGTTAPVIRTIWGRGYLFAPEVEVI